MTPPSRQRSLQQQKPKLDECKELLNSEEDSKVISGAGCIWQMRSRVPAKEMAAVYKAAKDAAHRIGVA